MNIDIWSDIACPFCYLGNVQLTNALNDFAHKDQVTVTYHSFELDPSAPRDYNGDMYDMLVHKKGLPREQIQQMVSSIVDQAANLGLSYDMDSTVITNTNDAHRLAHFARKHNKQPEMIDRLYRAYFTEGKHVGDHATLANLAGAIGLNKDEALNVLQSDDYVEAVRQDISQAQSLGITGVPFTVIDQKYGISGAQGQAVFAEALQKAWHDAHPLQIVGSENAAVCVDGSC